MDKREGIWVSWLWLLQTFWDNVDEEEEDNDQVGSREIRGVLGRQVRFIVSDMKEESVYIEREGGL
jgi:hypothetical protein